MMSSPMLLYGELMKEGKKLAAEGKLYESLSKLEHAKQIQATPKVLERIQKLKEFIKLHRPSNTKLTSDYGKDSTFSTKPNSFRESTVQSISPALPKNSESCIESSIASYKSPEVLNEIQNTKVIIHTLSVPESVKDLNSEQLVQFNKLKKQAMAFSYEGKFEHALKVFQQALKICNCPVVRKYIEDIKSVINNHSKELQDFQHLTNTGETLAAEGKQLESLGKLKEAFKICPSPKVSRIIQKLEKSDLSSMKLFGDEKCSDSLSEQSTRMSSSSMSDNIRNEESDFMTEESEADPRKLSPEKLARYKDLYKKARKDASEGRLQEALNALTEACSICKTEKVLNRIKDLKEVMKNVEVDTGDQMVAITEGFSVFHEIYEKLYPYQRLGVAWMWGLFQKRKGGVLGDDMGLGKTFQVIAFLSGLIDAELVKHILIIMPVSLLPNWEKEFTKWCPGIKVYLFHGNAKRERERNALRVQHRGHVLLTSYGMVVNNLDLLNEVEGERFIWDYVILDEGHKIKNPTKTTKAVHEIPAKNRLVLTGTPIQNNLRELWALYNFVHQGALLGSMKTFKMQYENIITRAREKDATVGEKRLGTEMADNLKKLIQPYFLRRSKSEIWGDKSNSKIEDIECKMTDLKISDNKVTSRKNDFIVWLTMSNQQCEIYSSFLHSNAVKRILVSKRSPLVELTTLKKVCDHPRLLSQRACLQLGLNGKLEEDLLDEIEDESLAASSIENVSDETLINESGKMKFLINLLENLKENGHRTLIFSLSRKILDMIHRILTNRQWKVVRIDGTVTKIEEREKRIQLFQNNPSYPVFLLTTQVGGVGITLTAADRVVIYDPSWNPATDAQAVDRAYRIGQKKNVIVYRLMTCGTVEEKIYRRQIFKDSITRQATGSSDPYRYFSKQELRELFTLDNPNFSATQVQLSEMHSGERKTDVSLDEHIAFLHSLDIFGISDHDLMFTKNITDNTEDNDEAFISQDYIKKKVATAQQLIQAEAAVAEGEVKITGNFSRPYLESIPSFKKNSDKDLYKPPPLPEVIDLTRQSPISTDERKLSLRQLDNNDAEDDISVFSPPSVRSEICADNHKENGTYFNKVMENKRQSLKYEPLSLEKNKFFGDCNMTDEEQKMTKFVDASQHISIADYSHGSHGSPISIKRHSKQLFNTESKKYEEKLDFSIKNHSLSTNYENEYPDSVKINFTNTYTTIQSPKQLNISTIKNPSYQSLKTPDKVFAVDVSYPGITTAKQNLKENNSIIIGNCVNPLMSSEKFKSKDKIFEYSYEAISENKTGDIKTSECRNTDHINTSASVELQTELSEEQKLTACINLEDQDSVLIIEDNNSIEANENGSKINLPNDFTKTSYSSDNECKDILHYDNADFIKSGNTSRIEADSSVEAIENGANTKLHSDCNKTSNDSDGEDICNSNNADFMKSGNTSRCLSKAETSQYSTNNSFMGDILNVSQHSYSTNEKTEHQLFFNQSVHQASSVSPSDSPLKMPMFEQCQTSSPLSKRASAPKHFCELFLNESLNEAVPLKNKRKSCASRSRFLSESDSSQQASCSTSANTSQECIVTDNEEEMDDKEDPSKNSMVSHSLNESVSFIPSSIPSTPLTKIPVNKNSTVISSALSPRRITPLRLHKSHISSVDSPFAKALATSPLIHVTKTETTLIEPDLDDLDSPVKLGRRNFRNAILSDSEDSEEEVAATLSTESSSSIYRNISVDTSRKFKTPVSRPQSIDRSCSLSYRSVDSDFEVSDESECQ